MDAPLTLRSFTGGSGNRLVGDAGGNPTAPAVILLHGGGQTRNSWGTAQRELIDAGYFVLSVDARGHGESAWTTEYTLDGQVADVRALAATLPGKPALIGASMGGVAALIACGEDPQLASALVLVDVTPTMESEGVSHIRRFMTANPDGFSNLDEVADAIAAYNPLRPRPRSTDGLRKNLRLRDNGRWYWHWDPNIIADDQVASLAAIARRMASATAGISLPALLIRGRQSDIVSAAGAADLRRKIPHLEYADIEGAGHMIAGDRNDAFNGAILEFLARRVPITNN